MKNLLLTAILALPLSANAAQQTLLGVGMDGVGCNAGVGNNPSVCWVNLEVQLTTPCGTSYQLRWLTKDPTTGEPNNGQEVFAIALAAHMSQTPINIGYEDDICISGASRPRVNWMTIAD